MINFVRLKFKFWLNFILLLLLGNCRPSSYVWLKCAIRKRSLLLMRWHSWHKILLLWLRLHLLLILLLAICIVIWSITVALVVHLIKSQIICDWSLIFWFCRQSQLISGIDSLRVYFVLAIASYANWGVNFLKFWKVHKI